MKFPRKLDEDLAEKGVNNIESLIINFPSKPTSDTNKLYSQFQENCAKIVRDLHKKQILRNSEGLIEKTLGRIFYWMLDSGYIGTHLSDSYKKGAKILKERGFPVIIRFNTKTSILKPYY